MSHITFQRRESMDGVRAAEIERLDTDKYEVRLLKLISKRPLRVRTRWKGELRFNAAQMAASMWCDTEQVRVDY